MRAFCIVLIALLASAFASAQAEEAVSLGGGYALLNKPRRITASAVLLPGGNGYLGIQPDGSFSGLANNQLVRTRAAYAAQGIATLTLDSGVSVSSAITYLRQFGRPVAVVATSRGSLKIPGALSAHPNGIVLTSSFLDDIRSSVGSPGALPPTLVIHHRSDGCRYTPPSAVEPFAQWAGGRARVVWMSGGQDEGNPCQAGGHHGFAGQDGQVVSTVARFVKSLR